MSWLTGWTKRKEITLTGGASGAQVDFQLELAVSYEAAMQGDFDDLRFTQADSTTLVDAWCEVKIDDTSATVWVEFPTTPANTVEQTYYMYYGKADAVSDWDGDATFVLYTGLKTTNYVSSLDISGPGYAYRNSMQGDQENTHLAPGFGDSAARFPTNSILFGTYVDNNYIRKVYVAGVEKLSVTGGLSWAANTPYIHDILWDSSGVSFWKDGVQWGATHTGDTPTANVGIFNYYHIGTGQINWQFIRKYAANPPTYGFGAEQSVPTGAIMNQFQKFNIGADLYNGGIIA